MPAHSLTTLFSLITKLLLFALFFDFLCSSSSQATHHNFVSPLRLLPFFYSLFSFLFMLGLGLVSLFFPPSFISFSYWVSGFGFYFIFLFSFLSFLHWVSRWMRMKAMIASGFGERRWELLGSVRVLGVKEKKRVITKERELEGFLSMRVAVLFSLH